MLAGAGVEAVLAAGVEAAGVVEVEVGEAVAVVVVEVELGKVVAAVVEVEVAVEVEAVVSEVVVAADVVEPLLEAGCVVDSAVEAALPGLVAFPPQPKVTAVQHNSTTVLNKIFFMKFISPAKSGFASTRCNAYARAGLNIRQAGVVRNRRQYLRDLH